MSSTNQIIPTLYAEMMASRPSVQDGKKVKIVSLRMPQNLCVGLASGDLTQQSPNIFGHNNDGALCFRMLGIVPRDLLHPEATISFRVSNQYGSTWERRDTDVRQVSAARQQAERLFRNSDD